MVKVPDVVITLDSREGNDFYVVYGGKLYRFEPYDNGLYYYDTTKAPTVVKDNISKQFTSYSFLQTIEDNKAFYTDLEVKGADAARKQQEEIGWPSDTFYKHIIGNNLLTNTEVTLDDVVRAEYIYGPA